MTERDQENLMQGWAHQLELEHQQFEETLAADPAYLEWLKQLEDEYDNRSPR